MSHLWKQCNRKEQKFSSFQACTNLASVRCLPLRYLFLLTRSFHLELNQLTGIAAILTFPLDVEVVEAEEAEEEAKGALEEE
jgi:hypothetical protein